MSPPVRTTQAVIVCGGRGSRLGVLADAVPKALQPVAGRVFLDWLLKPVLASGVGSIHFCLGHLAWQIRQYLIRYDRSVVITCHEEARPRGTAGALCDSKCFLEDVFIVLMVDTYLNVDYRTIASQLPDSADAMMVVTEKQSAVSPNVEIAEGMVVRYDKSGVPNGCTDTGVAVIRRRAVENLSFSEETLDLGLLFWMLIERGTLAAQLVAEQFYDIGTLDRLRHFEDHVRTFGDWSR